MKETPNKRPIRFFNTTGPCNPWDHYMLPPKDRLVGAQLDRYIRDNLYWVLHAPRQTGKTTFLQSWTRELNCDDKVTACYVSLESCQGITDRAEAMITIHKSICAFASKAELPVPELSLNEPILLLDSTMHKWSEMVFPKPLVVLFDEVDVLEGEPLISFLRQLRGGFAERGEGKFPVSAALVGMRDLKDYITASKGGVAPNPGSPFNVKEDSIFISNFSKEDIISLFKQRTQETGQKITSDAIDFVYEQSWGQPWIVNNLFKRATMRVLNENNFETVTIDHILAAREQMIQARETHLDALSVRLRDPRIRHVIESIISGESDPNISRTNPDVELAMDLGLIKWHTDTGFMISNPIYEDILTRHLNAGFYDNLPSPSNWKWQKEDGRLDMDSLLKEFQLFWRSHSEIWEEKSDYTEVFPHLLLTAFFQRILNGGGRIDREVAAGRGRMDLCVEYKDEKFIIEIKLIRNRDNPDNIQEDGLRQISMYRDKTAPSAPAYLILFDRRDSVKNLSWNDRLSWNNESGIVIVRS